MTISNNEWVFIVTTLSLLCGGMSYVVITVAILEKKLDALLAARKEGK